MINQKSTNRRYSVRASFLFMGVSLGSSPEPEEFFPRLPESSLKAAAVYPDSKLLLHFIQERRDPQRRLLGPEPFDKGQHFGRELMSASRAALPGQKPW